MNSSGIGILWHSANGRLTVATPARSTFIDNLVDLHSFSEKYWFSNLQRNGDHPTGVIGNGRIILPDDWCGLPLSHLMVEMGHTIDPEEKRIRQSAAMMIRVARMTALVTHMLEETTMKDRFGNQIRQRIFESPRLCEHLNQAMRAAASRYGPYRQEVFKAFHHLSTPRLITHHCIDSSELKRVVVYRFPGFSHAERLAGSSVPGAGNWDKRLTRSRFTISHVSSLARLIKRGRPTMLLGKFQSRPGMNDRWFAHLTSGSCQLFGRGCYTLEETIQLNGSGQLHVDGVMLGPDWKTAGDLLPFGKLLDCLVEYCGGRAIACNSWSANLVAYNALLAQLPGPDPDTGASSLQSAWLSVHDRLSILPAMKLIEDHHSRTVFSGAGCIGFVPDNDKSEHGELAEKLKKSGMVEVCRFGQPVSSKNHDGGLPDDKLLAHFLQENQTGWIRKFDELPFLARKHRTVKHNVMAAHYRELHE